MSFREYGAIVTVKATAGSVAADVTLPTGWTRVAKVIIVGDGTNPFYYEFNADADTDSALYGAHTVPVEVEGGWITSISLLRSAGDATVSLLLFAPG